MEDAISLRINEDRFRENFEELARIGATPKGGVNRPTFSAAHTEARSWFNDRALQAGLEFNIDGAGNHSAILHLPKAKKTILLGSHLDSVPSGGRFDGALGVLAALEALVTIKESNLQFPVHFEAIDFTDEESTHVEFLGSRAFTGNLDQENLISHRGNQEEFNQLLANQNLSEQTILTCGRDLGEYAGYLELHIEQGPRLENDGFQIGIVTNIVGLYFFRIIFKGRADHAGTTPMQARLDAGLGASAFTLEMRRILLEQFPSCVANVGRMAFNPGASNVVPEQVEVTFEFRTPTEGAAIDLEKTMHAVVELEADRYGLEFEVIPTGRTNPVAMDTDIGKIINKSVEGLDLKGMKLSSGAGHDAQILAQFTPSGLIFVPSIGGISHNPKEYSKWADCVNGANVLLSSAIRLALEVD